MGKILRFDEVAYKLVSDPFVVKDLSKQFTKEIAYELIIKIAAGDSPERNGVHLYNYLEDLLRNEGRLYRRYMARGSFGNYSIDIRGLGGVYFYEANEFGATGYFLSLEDTDNEVTSNWMDNLVSSTGRWFRDAFVDVVAEKTAASAALNENTIRARSFLATKASIADWDVWGSLVAGPVPEDSELRALLAKRYFEIISGDALFNIPTEQQRPIWWLFTNSDLTINELLNCGGESIVNDYVDLIAFKLEESKRTLKKTSGPARIGAAAAVQRWEQKTKYVDSTLRVALRHSSRRYRNVPTKWIELSPRQTREELIRRGWAMRGSWTERSTGTSRIVLSGRRMEGDKKLVAISIHPRFWPMSESVALSLIETELAIETQESVEPLTLNPHDYVADFDKPTLVHSFHRHREMKAKSTIASFSRCPYAILHEQDRYSMTSDWTDAIVVTLSKSAKFGIFARKNYEVMDTAASRKWVTLDRWTGLKTEREIYKAITQAESILDVAVDWEVVTNALSPLDPKMTERIQKLAVAHDGPDD